VSIRTYTQQDFFSLAAPVEADPTRCKTGCPISLSDFDAGMPEISYAKIADVSRRKSFGQFFTPLPIAEFMTDWIIEQKPGKILDPAVGTGVFLRSISKQAPQAEITAIDIDSGILEAARLAGNNLPNPVSFINADFLTWRSQAKFPAIIMNPPYIRHHDLNYPFDVHKFYSEKIGLRLSRLMNLYGLFIIEACLRLAPKGRAAIIVPTEWTNANFGTQLKKFLLHNGLLSKIVYFCNMGLVFEDALTTACILLIEEGAAKERIDTYFVPDVFDKSLLSEVILHNRKSKCKNIFMQRIPSETLLLASKWDYIVKNGHEKKRDSLIQLKDIASTKRGIATGANEFFQISQDVIEKYNLSERTTVPCVGKAADVKGYIFTRGDLEGLKRRGKRCFLVNCGETLKGPELDYIRFGETQGYQERYLCRVRPLWYRMEKRAPAPIWAAVFGRNQLRFIYNQAMVHNLTCFHCIYTNVKRPFFDAALVACLNSPVMQKKAQEQMRVYGGGLLKFEPGDLLELTIPNLIEASEDALRSLAEHLADLDDMRKKGNNLINKKLQVIDSEIEHMIQ